jgi:hypothetical protein
MNNNNKALITSSAYLDSRDSKDSTAQPKGMWLLQVKKPI